MDYRVIVVLVIVVAVAYAARGKQGVRQRVSDEPAGERPPVPVPGQFRVTRDGRELQITVPWLTAGLDRILLTASCIILGGVMLAPAVLSLVAGTFAGDALLTQLPVAILGLAFAYYALASLINRAVIRADGEHLVVRHTPLPWFERLDLSIADLEQLYAVRHRSRRRLAPTYALQVVLRDGRVRKVLGGLQKPDHALYLEQALEEHLGIVNRAVDRELEHASGASAAS